MIAENMGTIIVSGLFSFGLALVTYYGIVKRVKAEESIANKKAAVDATKAESELDLKLSERVDRLRAKLWEDVEEKMATQAERIVIQDRRIEQEAQARGKLEIIVGLQTAQLELQAAQIKQLEGEIKEKDAYIKHLETCEAGHAPATL